MTNNKNRVMTLINTGDNTIKIIAYNIGSYSLHSQNEVEFIHQTLSCAETTDKVVHSPIDTLTIIDNGVTIKIMAHHSSGCVSTGLCSSATAFLTNALKQVEETFERERKQLSESNYGWHFD